MMAMIYNRASEVLLCVGAHEDESEAVFEFGALDEVEKFNDSDGRGAECQEWISKNHERYCLARLCQAMSAFISRPYWNRMWIVQEIVLATKRQVLCGKDALSWTQLTSARYVACKSMNDPRGEPDISMCSFKILIYTNTDRLFYLNAFLSDNITDNLGIS